MKNKNFLTLILFITFLSAASQKQLTTFKGKIINRNNGALIPYCNITDGTTNTCSNEKGEFTFNTKTLPNKLIISHLNYETKNISITSTENVVVKLIKKNSRIRKTKSENEAIVLVDKAYHKIKSNLSQKSFGKAYYKQKTFTNANCHEFSEILFNAEFNSNGINDWDLIQGRHALKSGYINNRNFSYFSKIIKTIQPETDAIIFPLRTDAKAYYNIAISEVKKSKDQKIAILSFKPKTGITTPIFEGKVSIDMNNFDVYRIFGTIRNDDVEMIQFSKKNRILQRLFIIV